MFCTYKNEIIGFYFIAEYFLSIFSHKNFILKEGLVNYLKIKENSEDISCHDKSNTCHINGTYTVIRSYDVHILTDTK